MATQEELAKAWSKGQPGFGLYLGCNAVRKTCKGASDGGRCNAGSDELTVVTVENVVNGKARVRTGEGSLMGASVDTLVLFKPVTTANAEKQHYSRDRKSSIIVENLSGDNVEEGKSTRTLNGNSCAQPGNWSHLFPPRSEEQAGSSSDLQDDSQEERESKDGLDWRPGQGTSSGNNWYDCMKYIGPVPPAEPSSLRTNQPICSSVGVKCETKGEREDRDGLDWKPGHGTSSGNNWYDCMKFVGPVPGVPATGHPGQGRTSNHKRAGCQSRRNKREVREPRGGMESPTMEEAAEEKTLDVSHLIKQLKVARGTEEEEVEGLQHGVGGGSYGMVSSPRKVEEIVNMKQTKQSPVLEGSPIVGNRNAQDGMFEGAKYVEAIDDHSEIEVCVGDSADVSEKVGAGDREGEDEFEATATRTAAGNQETEILKSSCERDLFPGEGDLLPTSLPTAASVSRWVEGDQLHKVGKYFWVKLRSIIGSTTFTLRWILKRRGYQQAYRKREASPACAGPSYCSIFMITYLLVGNI